MELADGNNIQNHIKLKVNGDYFTENVVWRLLIHCLVAIDHLHNLKVFHQDIKQENIFIFYNNSNTNLEEATLS